MQKKLIKLLPVYHRKIVLGIASLLWLAGCGQSGALPTPAPTAVWPTSPPLLSVVQPLPATATGVVSDTAVSDAVVSITAVPTSTAASPTLPTPNPASPRLRLAADTAVPATITTAAQKFAQQRLAQYSWSEPGEAHLLLTTRSERPLARWVYALAAPFPTVPDGLTLAELQTAWQSGSLPVVITESGAAALTPILGAPGTAVQIVPEGELRERLWAARPSATAPSLTILPFDQLMPDLKVLALDGQSPLAADFAPESYPLTVSIGVEGEATAVNQFQAQWDGPTGNYDPAKITRVALTGVTALVRATAFNMEQRGILWPGEEVGPVLRAADIAHVSNEVSFAPDCPYPDPIGGTTFCSRDRYFDLILDIGADVIDLTGNHLNDWGRDNTVRTIEMYEAAGLQTFGGGYDLTHAAAPALFDHNDNRIAFVGCNSFGPAFGWASETGPGARPCDGALPTEIANLRAQGYLVFVTLQYTEYYQYAAPPDQVQFFREMAAAGATAVSGSQAHHAQGFAFYNDAFIHYGPGNLFFDQMDMMGTRQTFVDTYVVVDGRLLSVELWTGLIENYARPRQMTPAEREQFLQTVFQASGW
ncbi:MAG: CapA family protein [Anaerolineae bacterium]|nr:CapA family protein [Anaerolineae bacterium]